MTDTLTIGGGCFWCVETIFERLRGVTGVMPGYAGGRRANPTYEQVCTGATGHAEVVQITFDPDQISVEELLEFFFAFHDPTTLNAQGVDTGTQYRSVILYNSPAQEEVSRRVIAKLERDGAFDSPIVTEVVPLEHFWPAEAYHHHYFQRNPDKAYCAATIAPKVAKLRRKYADRLKPEPAAGSHA